MKELKLKIADIVIDSAAQPRAGSLDQEHVEELEAAYRAKRKIEPPTVWLVGKEYRLAQGFHRVEAARRAGLTSLVFHVEEGTDNDWRIDAACSNQGHGLKRTNKDKRRCVTLLFKLVAKPTTDSLFAEMAGVSEEFVRKLRAELAPTIPTVGKAGGKNDDGPTAKRVGKDGREYPATKPKPAPAAEVAAEPEATPEPVKLPAADPTPAEQPFTGDDAGEVEEAAVPAVEAEEAPMPTEVADPAAEYVSRLNRLCVAIDKLKADVLGLADSPFGRLAHTESVTAQLVAARQSLWLSRPTELCPVAAEHADGVNCRVCLGTGYTSEAAAKRAEKSKGRGL